MKFLERVSLIIFSLIILIIAIVVCMLTVGWLNLSTVNVVLVNALNDITISNIMLVVSILFILLAIRNIFFISSPKKESKEFSDGVLLQNENGQLLISKETIENIVSNIAKGFEGTQDVETRVVLDKENNINVEVTLYVQENTIIKDLSSKIQWKIKEAVKETADLDVKKVDIQIKNITPQEVNVAEK